MTRLEIIARVVVGSQLHGLATPDSDTDIRTIWRDDIQRFLSFWWPSQRPSMVGEGDEQSWELARFVGLLVKGNPTVLEVLWSDRIPEQDSDGCWDRLREERRSILDPEAVYTAHRGYAFGQHRLIDRSLGNGNQRRADKAAIAAIRVAEQGRQLLSTGDFDPVVACGDERDFLMTLKTEGIGERRGRRYYEWKARLNQHLNELDLAFASPHPSLKLDRGAVNLFLSDTYISR